MVDINRFIPCSQCQCMMKLTYGEYGYYYICVCGLTHGCHQQSGEPLGIPADKETRQLRIKAHQYFDIWYKSLGIKRRLAYRRLSKIMDLSQEETHIGRFDKNQCQYLIDYLTQMQEN